MDAPLWTDAHAPSLSELPQAEVRDRLERAVEQPMNLVLQGPPGVGKTAAARALAREAHDDLDNDLIEINVADFFARTKKELREDPRFEHFLQGQTEFSKQYRRGSGSNKYKRDWSKRDMISHVLKEMAGYRPSTGEYKTLVLDNAESIREDFQQALRRVMERHHRTTQFVITTRQPSKLIPPIRSRCFPVPVRAPTVAETVEVLRRIAEAEGVEYEEAALGIVANYGGGDLRTAVLGAQTVATEVGELATGTVHEPLRSVGDDDEVESVLADAEAGDVASARTTVGNLLDEGGYDGQALLRELLRVARKQEHYGDEELARLHRLAGEVDLDLAAARDDRTHLVHLLAEWSVSRGARA
jgi:replication factor C small subunit